jgi:CheY-like chemotaxis protein
MPDETTGPSLRVLLVDDWPDAAKAMAALMRLWGHDARIAHDGAAALDLAALYRPHVIFLDVGLPGIDGYQVARRLRANPSFHETFIVSVTGCADEESQRLSREAGCDGHLTKPVDLAGLERLLASRRQRLATLRRSVRASNASAKRR